jgi:aarF domain-containing kinase
LSPAAKDALLAVFSKKGSYVQQLLVEELVAATDALSREALSETLRLLLGSAPVALAMSNLEALGPLRPLLLPFTTPLELLSRLAPAVAVTPEDEEALAVVRGIFQLVQQMGNSGSVRGTNNSVVPGSMVFSTTAGQAGLLQGPRFGTTVPMNGRTAVAAAAEAVSDVADVARELQPLLPELLPGLTHTGELFVRAFTQRVATRLAESLSSGSSRSDAEDAERAMAMAALSFIQTGQGKGNGLMAMGRTGGSLGTTATPIFSTTPMAASPLFSSSNSAAGVFGGSSGNVRDPAQKPHAPGFGPASLRPYSASSSLPAATVGGLTAGQLVTGLVAAPLLVMLTPLAVLSEMQRRHRQGPHQPW